MSNLKKELQALIGDSTYASWVDMLRRLVPDGRTHRLSPMIAGMLLYANLLANDMDLEEGENSLVDLLQEASEVYEPSEAYELLLPVIDQLFGEAGVPYKRTNARGKEYNIAYEIIYEYVHWHDMPWEA